MGNLSICHPKMVMLQFTWILTSFHGTSWFHGDEKWTSIGMELHWKNGTERTQNMVGYKLLGAAVRWWKHGSMLSSPSSIGLILPCWNLSTYPPGNSKKEMANHGKSRFLVSNSTESMAIFNGCHKWPEGSRGYWESLIKPARRLLNSWDVVHTWRWWRHRTIFVPICSNDFRGIFLETILAWTIRIKKYHSWI